MEPTITVTAFDHIVLACPDVERTLAWYQDVLGLPPVRVEEWRAGRAPFPSVRISADSIIDLIPGTPESGRLNHFCLVIEPTDVVEGPVTRYGARGNGTSVYVRDPDGTVVELRHY